MGQKSASYDADGNIIGFYDSDISPAPDGATTIDITDEQWMACLGTPGYKVVNGELVAPAAPTEDEIIAAALPGLAMQALSSSDLVIIRAYEAGKPVTPEWQSYRAELRLIVGGNSTLKALPDRPTTYPA